MTAPNALPPIILASGSPRRRELLASLGLAFDVIPADIDEAALDVTGLTPFGIVCKLAQAKAEAVADARIKALGVDDQDFGALVIGSDTIVVLADAAEELAASQPEGEPVIFGKPADADDAHRMLSLLAGRTHLVYSGIAVFYRGQWAVDALKTGVTFRAMSPDEITRYIATGEPMDKAGAYAIQGLGSLNVERVDGCYFNVVGMSLYLLNRLFAQLGVRLL